MPEHYRNISRTATPIYYILGNRLQGDKPLVVICPVSMKLCCSVSRLLRNRALPDKPLSGCKTLGAAEEINQIGFIHRPESVTILKICGL